MLVTIIYEKKVECAMYYLLCEPYRFLKYQYKKSVIMYNGLFPIEINHEALEILRLCDGTRTLNDIIEEIGKIYRTEKNVSSYVSDFIDYAANNKLVRLINTKKSTGEAIIVGGSKEYWSPIHITLELTHNCPLKCKHCFINAGIGQTMSTEFLEKITREMVDIGVKSVQLTGGEPLVHPNIIQLIDFLNDAGIRINITTSGYYSNKNIISSISRIKLGYVQVSLDGLEQRHNSIRGRNDAYKRAVEFVSSVIAIGKKVVVATCFMDQSYDELCA